MTLPITCVDLGNGYFMGPDGKVGCLRLGSRWRYTKNAPWKSMVWTVTELTDTHVCVAAFDDTIGHVSSYADTHQFVVEMTYLDGGVA